MLNANGQTYDTLGQYAETIELDGVAQCDDGARGAEYGKLDFRCHGGRRQPNDTSTATGFSLSDIFVPSFDGGGPFGSVEEKR